MSAITLNPLVLNNSSLVVGTDNYEASVKTVRFDPTTPTVTFKGLSPSAVYPIAGVVSWTVTLNYAQDWGTTNSLSQYLWANVGTTKSMVFKPIKPATGAAPTITATVLIQPGSIGGDVDSVAEASVTLLVQGQPVLATV